MRTRMGVRLSPSRSSRPLVKAAAEVCVCVGGGGAGRDEKEKRDRLGEVGGRGGGAERLHGAWRHEANLNLHDHVVIGPRG